MACGYGACFGCAVPKPNGGYMRFCVDGPVVRTEKEGGGVPLRSGVLFSASLTRRESTDSPGGKPSSGGTPALSAAGPAVDFCGIELAPPG